MRRYAQLFWQFSKMSLMNQLAYPPSFILAVIAKSLRVGILLVFFSAVYLYAPTVAGWTFNDVALLLAVFLTYDTLIAVTFQRNMSYYLPDMLRRGTFDFILLKPVSPLFTASFRIIDMMDLMSFIPVAVLWGYCIRAGAISGGAGAVLLAVGLMLCGFVLLYAMLLVIASTAFWTVTTRGAGKLFEHIVRLGRYPPAVYQGSVRFVLLYILPIVLIVGTPATVMRGMIAWKPAVILAGLMAIMMVGSLLFWKFALRHYSSASS